MRMAILSVPGTHLARRIIGRWDWNYKRLYWELDQGCLKEQSEVIAAGLALQLLPLVFEICKSMSGPEYLKPIKALAKPDDTSLFPGTHMVGRESEAL